LFSNYYLKFLKLIQNAYIPFDKYFTTRFYDSFHLSFKDWAIYKFTSNDSFQDFISAVDFLDKKIRCT